MASFKSYGLRQLWIAELKDETAIDMDTMYGNLIRLEGAQEFSATPKTETTELTGDDSTLETDSQLMSYDVAFKHLLISDFTFIMQQVSDPKEHKAYEA